MMKFRSLVFPMGWTVAALTIPLSAADKKPSDSPDFTQPVVLALMEKVGDWQLAHRSTLHDPTFWTEGAMYTGMMALAEISPSPRFREAMVKTGEGNKWQLGPRPYHADDYCVGQTYADLYAKDKDPKMIAAMVARFDNILAHPKDDDLNFDKAKHPDRNDRWSWCDALFMGPPAWLRLAAVTGKKEYFDFAVKNWWKTSAYLYDPQEHLYFRDSTYFEQREANGKKIFWSRGNGWVIGGLARVIPYLPEETDVRGYDRTERLDQTPGKAGAVPEGMQAPDLQMPSMFGASFRARSKYVRAHARSRFHISVLLSERIDCDGRSLWRREFSGE